MSRRSDVQRCPAVPAAAKVTPRTTSSMSALGAMTAALLPPSSRMLRPKRAATTGATLRPMAVDPVALTTGTPSWASAVSGVTSLGFQMTGLPHTTASAVFQLHTATGKLNAVMMPVGPSGCHCSISRWPGRSLEMVRPCS